MNRTARLPAKTAAYFVGNIVYRGASFLLVPLYAHALSAADYGALELILTTTVVLQTVLSSGIAHSALRFYFEYDDPRQQNTVISTALIANLAAAGAIAAAVGYWAGPSLSRLVFDSGDYTLAFRLALAVLVLDISREISLAWIRAQERAGLFMVVSCAQLVAQVMCNWYAVVGLHMGITGVLLGNLVATAIVWLILTAITVWHCGLAFEAPMLWPLLRYGRPLMVSMLAASGFRLFDRFFLKSYTSLETLGAYALALRIANVFPVLFLTPFTNSYGAFRFAIMKEPDARETYSRVITYYTAGAAWIVLALACLSREIVHVAASTEYVEAGAIVPLLLLPGALGGINYCLQTGIYVTKHTKYLAYVSTITCLVNLGLVLLLTPQLRAFGPPVAAVTAALCTLAQTYVLSQRVLPIQLEWTRLATVVVAALGIGGFAAMLPPVWLPLDLGFKLTLVALFPAVLFVMRFPTSAEMTLVRNTAASLSHFSGLGWRRHAVVPRSADA